MVNIFSTLIGALHESRRRQAVQIIRGYPHLLHDIVSWKGLGVKSLITALVLGFGILHVIGGTMIDHARAAHAGPSAAVIAQGD